MVKNKVGKGKHLAKSCSTKSWAESFYVMLALLVLRSLEWQSISVGQPFLEVLLANYHLKSPVKVFSAWLPPIIQFLWASFYPKVYLIGNPRVSEAPKEDCWYIFSEYSLKEERSPEGEFLGTASRPYR